MRLRLALTRVLQTRWFDLRRSDIRDGVALFGGGILAYVAVDLAHKLFQLGIDYAEWKHDDTIFVFVMSIAMMMVYAFRRNRDLSKEIKSRISAELEARRLARHDR